jgi:hypothetical protein
MQRIVASKTEDQKNNVLKTIRSNEYCPFLNSYDINISLIN